MTQHLNHFIHRYFAGEVTGVPSGYTLAAGTRMIVPGWGGNLLEVRRSSDNTTMNIGASGSSLDTSALLSFCGVGDGFVRTVYDQSGNGRDFSQATNANQPQIVSGGSIITLGGQPALDFNGSTQFMETAGGIINIIGLAAGVISTVFNYDVISTNSPTAPYNNDALWADDGSFVGTHLVSGTPEIQSYNWDGDEDHASKTIAATTDYVHIWRHLSSTLYNYLNSSTPTTITSDPAASGTYNGKMRLGRQYSTQYYDGRIAEVIAWTTGLTDLQIAAVGAAVAAIYGITWS